MFQAAKSGERSSSHRNPAEWVGARGLLHCEKVLTAFLSKFRNDGTFSLAEYSVIACDF